ncbi:hypothetical protein [Neobacillus ginsengisoli]|uniref:Transposase n=1 Tax=Neobacillus ginsengisoli TaxID=904295 RepID=A0ABT9XWN1_9BACI|nr:hypothetical protein [Neobacillus ginsengisoli]MDQ0199983.1 hypothetical protein [Neobacillus ginsengisoli]
MTKERGVFINKQFEINILKQHWLGLAKKLFDDLEMKQVIHNYQTSWFL